MKKRTLLLSLSSVAFAVAFALPAAAAPNAQTAQGLVTTAMPPTSATMVVAKKAKAEKAKAGKAKKAKKAKAAAKKKA